MKNRFYYLSSIKSWVSLKSINVHQVYSKVQCRFFLIEMTPAIMLLGDPSQL